MKEKFKSLTSNKYFLVSLIIVVILIGVGATYAWLTWQSEQNTNFTLNIGEVAEVFFTGGNEINAKGIGPVVSEDEGEITEFQVLKKSSAGEIPLMITFNPTTLPDTLKNPSFKYKLYSKDSPSGTYTLVTEGNFTDKTEGTEFTISEVTLTSDTTYYKLIFYIDGNMISPNTMKGQDFAGIILVSSEAEEVETLDKTGASAPVLVDGMIPVYYDSGASTWKKADKSNLDETYKWYDYDAKMWANVVLVTDASRSKYASSANGTVVAEADVLAYYVWIPRYKYQLFNVAGSAISPVEIQIAFEKAKTEKSNGSTNGDWLTHPAFTFGTKELSGIWFGKFETTGDGSNPTVKPDLPPLDGQNVSEQYASSQKFASTTYLTSTGVNKADAHMAKNIEWGSVAYLSHSKYGRCTSGSCQEIAINNSYAYTGRSSGDPSVTTAVEAGSYRYNQYKSGNTPGGQLSSTTGNVYGIYDMNGGASEYVMAIMQDNTNTSTPMSGGSSSSNSGFTGLTNSSGLYTGTPFPENKYYDLYTYGTSDTDYSRRILGDATSETRGWYNDGGYFITPSTPWIYRSGYVNYTKYAGSFFFDYDDGTTPGWSGTIITEARSFRSVITNK